MPDKAAAPIPESSGERIHEISDLKSFKATFDYDKLLQRTLLAEQLIHASIDCVMAMDNNDIIIAWNQACIQYSGFKEDVVVGKSLQEAFPDIGNRPEMMEAIKHVKAGYKVFLPASQGIWLTGYFELHLVPLKSPEGEVTGILLIAHDVAHRVKAEEELKRLNAELEEKYAQLERTNAELANFTHITSHNLKEPLRKAYTFLEKVIVKDAPKLSNDSRSDLRRAQSFIQRIGLLSDSLRTLSELQTAPMGIVSLNDIAAKAVAVLKPRIAEQHASINIGTLPEISGSDPQLQLLMQQLLSNALKFHKPGAWPVINITASVILRSSMPAIPAAKEAAYICLSVQDNGIGIPPEDRARVFNLFEKGGNKDEYPGAGLGLTVVRKIAENHKGFVVIEDAIGGGAIIKCYLPYNAA